MLLLLAIPNVDGILKIVNFLLMLSVLVVLHEYGHFLLARRNGVRVNDFAVGFGPTIFKWTGKSGTNYRINIFPVGGYCAMQGEDGKSSEAEQQRLARASHVAEYEPDNFQVKSVWQRLAIIIAGPAANFAVALVLLFMSTALFGVARSSTTIGPLTPNMPAERVGLHTGDRIVAVNGTPIRDGDQMVNTFHGSLGKRLHVAYSRNGVTRSVDVTPVASQQGTRRIGVIGFQVMPEFTRLGFVPSLESAFVGFGTIIVGTERGLLALVTHPQSGIENVSGPIGLARAAAKVQEFGWGPYFQLAAALSISLGFFNLLPFPALDGGRAAFIIAELIRGRPVDPEREAFVHVAGFAVLMMLMIVVAYHDVANIVAGKNVL